MDSAATTSPMESKPALWGRAMFWSLFGLNFTFLFLGAILNSGDLLPGGAQGFRWGHARLSPAEWSYALAVAATLGLTLLTLHPACRKRDYSKAATLCICVTLLFVCGK